MRGYERSLRKVAREIGRIIEGYQAETLDKFNLPALDKTLEDYAKMLEPWAKLKGFQLAEASDKQDRKAWARATAEMGEGIRRELRSANVGAVFNNIMQRQVKYITSLPIDAAERVHHLVKEGLIDGTRAKEIAEEIARSGEVSESRAMLIARTETTRAATALTQARAQTIQSTHYIWRTVHDGRVRQKHRELDGKVFAWDNPPIASEDDQPVVHAHPGEIYNCRCRPEPIIPER